METETKEWKVPVGAPNLPTVALHFVGKDLAAYLPRLLGMMGEHVQEISCVLVDTTDESRQLLSRFAENTGKRVNVVEVTYSTHPQLYYLDTAETYANAGLPLGDEVIMAGCSGLPVIAKWSAVRELAWQQCTADWRLWLDADEVLLSPWAVRDFCRAMDQQSVEVVSLRYVQDIDAKGHIKYQTFSKRLAKNAPHISWYHPAAEDLGGYKRTAMVDGDMKIMKVTDLGERAGRSMAEDFRVLYYQMRKSGWNVPPMSLLKISEMAPPEQGAFAISAAEVAIARSPFDGVAKVIGHRLIGQRQEAAGKLEEAATSYESALASYPGTAPAQRLCRVRHALGDYVACIAAFNQAVANEQISQHFGDIPYQKQLNHILVADAYWHLAAEMGQTHLLNDAIEYLTIAMADFPESAALIAMKSNIVAGLAPGQEAQP